MCVYIYVSGVLKLALQIPIPIHIFVHYWKLFDDDVVGVYHFFASITLIVIT